MGVIYIKCNLLQSLTTSYNLLQPLTEIARDCKRLHFYTHTIKKMAKLAVNLGESIPEVKMAQYYQFYQYYQYYHELSLRE